MNIVWVEENLDVIADHVAYLIVRGHNVRPIYWSAGISLVRKVLRQMKPDLVIIHAGSVIQRSEAAELVYFAKSIGIIVIVDTCSPVLYEEADACIERPFGLERPVTVIQAVTGSQVD
ncbi:MAG: hypothetical protein FJ044_01195 [Candidatus Cloacimonetes bacterium]|nr:hypothetical protein [Candidatus Cloacimonadota bacterium]